MTNYIHNETLQVKTQGGWRKSFPNTSLPKIWNQNTLDFLNISPILAAPRPYPVGTNTVVVQDGYEKDTLGNYIPSYKEIDKFLEYETTDEAGEDVTITVAAQIAEEAARNLTARVDQLKTTCSEKILKILSFASQSNLQGAQSLGLFTNGDLDAYTEGFHWVQAMRANIPTLAANDLDMSDDANWPLVTTEMLTLIAKY